MAAGLGFKDFTTGEVLTAADVDGYLMQGIWVFASAAARDAAVTSPQEGNFAFLKDTNTTTYYTGSAWTNLDTTGMVNPMTTTGDTIYSSSGSTPARLGIGTTGQVLTVAGGVPSWATPSSGGGMTLLSTTSLSGSSTTISSISQSYKDLIIYGRGIYASAQLELAIRLNGDTGSNYAFQFIGAAGETAYANWSGGNTSGKIAWVDDASGYNNRTNLNMSIARYTESENRYVALQNYAYKDANTLCSNGHVMYNSTTAISSITFLLPSGSFSGGTIYIYGVN